MHKQDQRYISDELTHLFGRKQEESGESPYTTFLEILRSGWLTHPPHMREHGTIVATRVRRKAKISENEMYNTGMVCFCDIPLVDLSIHISKYGRFGLSFSKDFIARKGGSPVHYVPKEASLPADIFPLLDHSNKGEYFDDIVRLYDVLCYHSKALILRPGNVYDIELPPLDLDSSGAPKDLTELLNQYPGVLQILRRFFDLHVFCYLKFFDHNLPDDSSENFYFEREWRVLGNIQFKLDDVRRVLLPEEYAKTFRQDIPEYCGQVTFME